MLSGLDKPCDKPLCADCTTEHACKNRLDVPRACSAKEPATASPSSNAGGYSLYPSNNHPKKVGLSLSNVVITETVEDLVVRYLRDNGPTERVLLGKPVDKDQLIRIVRRAYDAGRKSKASEIRECLGAAESE